MRVETAIKMIENHGHKAFVTAEGLACVCQAVDTNHDINHIRFADPDDVVFEEVTTFPVLSYPTPNCVDAVTIRNWLGY